jgi:acetyl esterase/lipase
MHSLTKFILAIFVAVSCVHPARGAEEPDADYRLVTDLPYRDGDDLTDYMHRRCRLDVYYPLGAPEFPTVVWFHGGGLRQGHRAVPRGLRRQGLAVVPVDYRLHPQVNAPAYIEDAAAAVAWTFRNIARFGGSPGRIFVSGHSAGGYLTSMVPSRSDGGTRPSTLDPLRSAHRGRGGT